LNLAGISVLTAILFGLAPALRLTRWTSRRPWKKACAVWARADGALAGC